MLLRKERSAAAAGPEDRRYFLGGVQHGEITNNGNNDPDRVDWNQSILTKTWQSSTTPAPFRWNTTGGVTAAQMGADGYDPLSATGQGMSGTDGRHTVRAGDSLASIAAARWGDASLWYVLAQANGLTASSALTPGQSLIVPDKVVSNTNNASTFRPYDAAHAMGDVSPTTTKPPKTGNKCGVFGLILLAVIAIAVVAIAAPALIGSAGIATAGVSFGTISIPAITVGASGLAGALGAVGGAIVGGAIAGALGSAVSQLAGKALGIQSEFNFKAVGLAAIGGGIGGGLGALSKAVQAGSVTSGVAKFVGGQGLANGVARAVLSSAATQGIGKLTGLQDKISWAGVAGAGIGVGLAQQLGSGLGGLDTAGGNSLNNHLAHLGVSGASMLANAATRSILEGTDFGDNVLAALPDVIGQTVFDLARFGVVAKPRLDYDMTGLLDDDAVMASAASAPESNAGSWAALGDYGDRMHYKGGGEGRPFKAQPSSITTANYPDHSETFEVKHTQERAKARIDTLVGAWNNQNGSNFAYELPLAARRKLENNRIIQRKALEDQAIRTGDKPLLKAAQALDVRRPRFTTGMPAEGAWLVRPKSYMVVSPGATTQVSPANRKAAQPPEAQGQEIVVSGQNNRPSWADATPLAVTNAEQSFTQPSFDLGMLAAPQFDYHSPFGTSVVTNAINHSISAANRQATGGSGSGIGLELASATASFVPVLGTALGFYSLATGKDLITGKSVSRGEAAFGILLSAVPFGSIITKGKKFAKIGGEVAAAEKGGGRFAAEAQVVAGIERNADIAVELTRRQAARELVKNSEQAFGSRSHLLFDKLNTRLGRELLLEGSDFRLQSEVFRDSSLLTGARNAPGSIGADALLTHRVDPFYSRVFDLKTYGTRQIPITSTRQTLFQTRFGAQAEELYRVR